MHRGEKVSSKVCRERELEKAQAIHRKKLDSIMSHSSRMSGSQQDQDTHNKTFFRRKQRHTLATEDYSGLSPKRPTSLMTNAPSSVSSSISLFTMNDDTNELGSLLDEDSYIEQPLSIAFGKLDEFRSVMAPVMTYNSDHPPEPKKMQRTAQLSDGNRHGIQKTLHSAFRMRQLKQIEADNATMSERIKRCTAHYQNDQIKRDWEQNVTYMASISEFPLWEGTGTSHVMKSRKKTPFGMRQELPSLNNPPLKHPIKPVAISPRRDQVNLSPFFRSLRNALPKQPSLPPFEPRSITMTHFQVAQPISTTTEIVPHKEKEVDQEGGEDIGYVAAVVEEEPRPVTNSINSSHVSFTPYIPSPPTASRYTLLKTGRFIGGTYLVLTVYNGDGIANPYGFDVIGLNPASNVEYKLHITKEMTHTFLDTIASTSFAAASSVTAGTNMSMESIARKLCEHVHFTTLESSYRPGEMLFLIASRGSDHATPLYQSGTMKMLVHIEHSAMAFCVHQYVTIPDARNPKMPRQAHVFVSTHPQISCRASMSASGGTRTSSYDCTAGDQCSLVCVSVQLEPDKNVMNPVSSDHFELELRVDELIQAFETHGIVTEASKRVSLDCILVLSLNYIQFNFSDDTHIWKSLRLDASTGNEWAPVTKAEPHLMRQSKHSPQRRTSHLHDLPNINRILLLQTGIVWKNSFLSVRVAAVPRSLAHLQSPLTIQSFHRLQDLIGPSADGTDGFDLLFVVYNPVSQCYSERVLELKQIEKFGSCIVTLGASNRSLNSIGNDLEIDTIKDGSIKLLQYLNLLLLHLRLEMDHNRQEGIVFPSLEQHVSPRLTRRRSPSKPVISQDDGKLNGGSQLTTDTENVLRQSCNRDIDKKKARVRGCKSDEQNLHDEAPDFANGNKNETDSCNSYEQNLHEEANGNNNDTQTNPKVCQRKHDDNDVERIERLSPKADNTALEHDTMKHKYSAYVESLPSDQRSAVLDHAATRIQVACKLYSALNTTCVSTLTSQCNCEVAGGESENDGFYIDDLVPFHAELDAKLDMMDTRPFSPNKTSLETESTVAITEMILTPSTFVAIVLETAIVRIACRHILR